MHLEIKQICLKVLQFKTSRALTYASGDERTIPNIYKNKRHEQAPKTLLVKKLN